MSKLLIAVAALGVIGLGACAPHNTMPPGHYESTSSSTNAKGTKTTVDKETDVYYDRYGNKKSTVKTETTTDPKGLFNKETTTSTKTYN